MNLAVDWYPCIVAVAIGSLIRKIAGRCLRRSAHCQCLIKSYGRVTVIDHTDLDLYHGEILAVIGDNGAGKSPLINAISVEILSDEGEIKLNDKPVNFN